jgi:hypothetical protein
MLEIHFLRQNNEKSLKSDLYALTVLLAFEFLRFIKVSSNVKTFDICYYIIHTYYY